MEVSRSWLRGPERCTDRQFCAGSNSRVVGVAHAKEVRPADSAHADVPAEAPQLRCQVFRLPERFDDFELPSVAEPPTCDGSTVRDVNVVVVRHSVILVDECHPAPRPQALAYQAPERAEQSGRDM